MQTVGLWRHCLWQPVLELSRLLLGHHLDGESPRGDEERAGETARPGHGEAVHGRAVAVNRAEAVEAETGPSCRMEARRDYHENRAVRHGIPDVKETFQAAGARRAYAYDDAVAACRADRRVESA